METVDVKISSKHIHLTTHMLDLEDRWITNDSFIMDQVFSIKANVEVFAATLFSLCASSSTSPTLSILSS
jgi:hypothetical protein